MGVGAKNNGLLAGIPRKALGQSLEIRIRGLGVYSSICDNLRVARDE
jgi:hypothetical protein